jgi:uncharacterized protein with PQ loop repeat
MIESIGWIGAFFFSICAIPQAWQSFKEKHSNGLSVMFLVYWLLGEVFMLTYVMLQPELDLPLFVNYVVNLLLTSVIAWYKLFPQN